MASKKAKKVIRIPQKYVVAVDNGVKWLDLTFGRREWLRRMDMSDFNIQDTSTCVAGNVFRDAWQAESEMDTDSGFNQFESAMTRLGAEDAPYRLGFNAEGDKAMEYLQDLWVKKITNLKRAQR